MSDSSDNADRYGIDWDAVVLPPEKNPPRFQAGELSALHHWRLVAVSKILKKSIASVIQTAVITYLDRNEEKHAALIKAEAKIIGMTPEEYFSKIISEKVESERSRKAKARKSLEDAEDSE